MVKLSTLKKGEKAIITSIISTEMEIQLLEMGCLPGEHLMVQQTGITGDPISIEISGYYLSLRLQEADNILVDLIK